MSLARSSELDCPLCGPRAHRRVFRRGALRVLACRGCGLRRLGPESFATPAAALYGEDYFEGWGDRASVARLRARLFDAIAERAGGVRAGGRYLDVGCALGHMLDRAAARGMIVHGVELNAAAAREAAARHPGRVHEGTLDGAPFAPASFDLVTAVDVIEHVPDPLGLARRIGALLKPGGRAAFVLPDASSAGARWMGARWPHVIAEHLWHFAPRHMARLLAKAGLRATHAGAIRKPATLDYLASMTSKYPSSAWSKAAAAWARRLPAGLRSLAGGVPVGEMVVTATAPGRG